MLNDCYIDASKRTSPRTEVRRIYLHSQLSARKSNVWLRSLEVIQRIRCHLWTLHKAYTYFWHHPL